MTEYRPLSASDLALRCLEIASECDVATARSRIEARLHHWLQAHLDKAALAALEVCNCAHDCCATTASHNIRAYARKVERDVSK